MIKIDGKTIYIHRGDECSINYNVLISDTELYEFKVGDKIEFTVFENKGYNKTPVLEKIINIEKECTEVEINFTKEETNIGELSNKPIIYWYEISLNGVQTTNGYEYEDGASEFIILPAKGGSL